MFILQLLLLSIGSLILFYGIKGHNRNDDYYPEYYKYLITLGCGFIFLAILLIIGHFA